MRYYYHSKATADESCKLKMSYLRKRGMLTGEESVELGLVDGLGSSSYVAREIIQHEKIVDYTLRPDYWQRLTDRFGMAMARVLGDKLGVNNGSLR